MATTIVRQLYLSGGMGLLEVESDITGATFYRWRDGVFQGISKDPVWIFPLASGEFVQIDVFDSSEETPDDVYPSTIYFQWDGEDDAATYKVYEYIDEAWLLRRTGPSKGTGSVHSYISRPLEDGEEINLKIIPYDAIGQAGTALEYDITMIRRPDPEEFSVAIDGVTGGFVLTNG